jgi:hypothetical protein
MQREHGPSSGADVIPTTKTETDLLELMRADRLVLNKRQAEQCALHLEAASENQSKAVAQ